MKIKICGIRNKRDLKVCEEADADLIGFINIERSKRMVKIDKIKDLLSSMKDKNKAVLVIEPTNMADAHKKIINSGIHNIQLHSLSPTQIKRLREEYDNKTNEIENKVGKRINPDLHPPLIITRALGISHKIDEKKKKEIQDFADVSDYLLFDNEIHGKTGGTGKQIPTEIVIEAAKIAKTHNINIKLFLAGGMNVERIKNEGKILAEVFEFFDVNSGVENKPGVKNTDKINELMIVKALN